MSTHRGDALWPRLKLSRRGRCSISAANCSTLLLRTSTGFCRVVMVGSGVLQTAWTVGGTASSMTWSAVVANSSRLSLSVDANTIWTDNGRRWRNSCRRNESSTDASPSSCCIYRRNCDGVLSPSSSSRMNFWRLLCWDSCVCLIISERGPVPPRHTCVPGS